MIYISNNNPPLDTRIRPPKLVINPHKVIGPFKHSSTTHVRHRYIVSCIMRIRTQRHHLVIHRRLDFRPGVKTVRDVKIGRHVHRGAFDGEGEHGGCEAGTIGEEDDAFPLKGGGWDF